MTRQARTFEATSLTCSVLVSALLGCSASEQPILPGGLAGDNGSAFPGQGGNHGVNQGGSIGSPTGTGSSVSTGSPVAGRNAGGATGVGGQGSVARGGAASSAGAAARGGAPAQPSAAGYLHVEGNQLLDDAGHVARFTGVNWFGFETSNQSPHGLWARDYRSMLKQIRDVGFNTVRIPFSDRILRPDAAASSVNTYGADPYDQTDPMNADLVGKTPLEMLDAVVAAARELGLKLILDNHSRKPDGYMEEEVWYSSDVTEEQWIADWVSLAERYRGNPTVAAMDLDNEPHGIATWGTGDAKTDWNSAAERCGNAILEANPDVLIIVEGVAKVGQDGYWWGGNLSGVKTHPIQLSNPKKLVYSAHEHGPEVFDQTWFGSADFPANLAGVWEQHFDFIMKQNMGHILLGEFGLRERDTAQGRSGKWFDTVLTGLAGSYSWTFWCWNPNSGDTEGILGYDWLTPKQWKLDALAPYLAPPIGG
ncbi:MAG TPA: glycoside hydrolase family 5 protein [Polyangiaceae bacterium]|nr:glycoside hydrolase family 5 protein [Polyangiaceae bacterium]